MNLEILWTTHFIYFFVYVCECILFKDPQFTPKTAIIFHFFFAFRRNERPPKKKKKYFNLVKMRKVILQKKAQIFVCELFFGFGFAS